MRAMGPGGGFGGGGFAGGGGRGFVGMRSAMMRDDSIKRHKLAKGTVRRIAAFSRPFARQITAYVVLIVLDAVFTVLPPLLFKQIVDDGIARRDSGLVTMLALAVAGIAVADAVVTFVERYFAATIGEGAILALRKRVYAHVQRMPIAFFTRTKTGALISRLNNDVLGAQQAFTSTLSSVVSNVVSLVLVAATMVYLSWQVTALSLALVPVFLLPARFIGRRLRALSLEQAQLNAEMSVTMTERFNVAGALLVKLFGRPGEEDREFARRADRVRDVGVRIALTGRVFFTAMALVASLATALVYLIGGRLAIDGTLSLGTVLALATLLGRLYGPITALSNVRVDVMTALVSFERVFEVLDLAPMIADRPGAAPLPDDAASIEFDHVTFHYPTADEVSLASLESVAKLETVPHRDVLRDVSFRAAPGQLVALVGPSGAGKTTISGLVARLYDTVGGAVRIGGHDVRDVSLASLQRSIGMVTQEAHLFHESIRSNLLYAKPDADEAELVAACRDAQIWDLVASLPGGLDTVVGDRGHRLSGGEKQRLAIARLLLKAPRIVVLDEATAHLDSESEAAVQAALARALAHRTSIVIAHRLSTVRDADLILVVDGGRIVESGRHEALLAAGGLYAELYHTQFAGQARRADLPGTAAAMAADGSLAVEPAADAPLATEPSAGQ